MTSSYNDNQKRSGIFTLVVFCVVYGGAAAILYTIRTEEGNGGAFKAALAISLLFGGGLLTSLIGIITAISAYINRNRHVNHSFLCSVWFPLLLSSPPLVFFIWQYFGGMSVI